MSPPRHQPYHRTQPSMMGVAGGGVNIYARNKGFYFHLAFIHRVIINGKGFTKRLTHRGFWYMTPNQTLIIKVGLSI